MTSVIFRKQNKTFLMTLIQGGKQNKITVQEYSALEKAYTIKHTYNTNKPIHKINDIRKELENYLNLYLKTVCP